MIQGNTKGEHIGAKAGANQIARKFPKENIGSLIIW